MGSKYSETETAVDYFATSMRLQGISKSNASNTRNCRTVWLATVADLDSN